MPILNIKYDVYFLLIGDTQISLNDTLPTSLLEMSRTHNQAPAEAICSQLISHQLKDLSLLVQVAPPASQIGRQEATAWQVGWL